MTFPMERIVTALWNEVSKSIRFTLFVKELPHKIRRFAYCYKLGSTAACITVSHPGTSRCDCNDTVQYSTVRDSVRHGRSMHSQAKVTIYQPEDAVWILNVIAMIGTSDQPC